MTAAVLTRSEERLWGHPKGLYFLAMTEAWERFSFYGMRTLLVLYMVQELLLPGRIDNVAGMAGYRSVVEGIFGELSTQAFASQTFGLYAGFVYFTPLFGGLLADRWLGAKRVVMIGIALMTLGHFAMAFDYSFLIALLLLVLGSGCLKGNIAAQVGHLYERHEEQLCSKGYAIFSTGINIGATIGPLFCGLLAQLYGWHFGFGAAGVMMLIAAVVYFAGLKYFAEDRAAAPAGEVLPPLTRIEWRMIALVVFVLVLTMFQSFAYEQMFNVGLLWVSERVSLSIGGFAVPVPWFGAEDSFASVMILPVLLGLWAWQARRGKEPGDFGKLATGAAIMAVSAGMLALGSLLAGEGKVSILFPLIAYFLSGVAFMYQWPTALALVSRRAPAKINALMMAGAYLTLFAVGVISGFLARFYEPMGDTAFWTMHAAFSATGAIAIVLIAGPIRRRMDMLDG
ncbi:peptide MFS transporter [Qipengyuania marisflavi]|uniref:Peptide MFS transporter n=1 Tax=Qipengyuania marisflavi TaxID=2486356 RepID=A0A5S3P5W6_9SPHN|nr:peptide MFS transporter [Qipengyuania marisflavi]TMM48427.1 peptide MFS transporter [Qipengyuania marisflavi]